MKTRVAFNILAIAAVLAAAGCGGDQPKHETRSAAADRYAFPRQAIQYGPGFYGEENFKEASGAIHVFRWLQSSGIAQLPPWKGGAVLKFQLHVPGEILKPPPHIIISLNGQTLDSFDATKDVYDRIYPIGASDLHADGPNSLGFKTTKTITPSDKDPNADPRTFGLQITDLRLEPVAR